MINWLNDIDTQLFLALNAAGSPFLDWPMIWLSDKLIWIPLYAFLIYQLIRKTGWKFYVPLIAVIILITITDQVTSTFMKPYFERLRPCHEPSLEGLMIAVKGCGGPYGFASGHAANSVGLAFFFHFIFRNKYTLLLLVWAALVSYSRVYLGVHYPGDIIVGATIGWLSAMLVFNLMQWSPFRIKAG